MPWTLYRHMLMELLKLLVICTGVLVTVMSFAASIKPLSDGLLTPLTFLRYVSFLMPTMLTMALPFAAAFSATLVFNRLAADNEITACAASGISYRVLLMPVVVLGLGLTLGTLYLSNWVVPNFYMGASRMLEKDVTRVVVNQLREKQAVAWGRLVVYADQVDDTQPPPVIEGSKVQPDQLIMLRGAALGVLDERGQLVNDSTAQRADVLLYRVGVDRWAALRLENVMYFDKERGEFFFVKDWEIPPLFLPSPLKDSPRFRTYGALRELMSQPENFTQVRRQMEQLAHLLANQQLLFDVEQALTNGKAEGARLQGPLLGETYQLTAPQVELTKDGLRLQSQGEQMVMLNYFEKGLLIRQTRALQAEVEIRHVEPDPEPRLQITMKQANVRDLRDTSATTDHEQLLPLLVRWPVAVYQPLTRGLSWSELVERAQRTGRPTPALEAASEALRSSVVNLSRRIIALLHERAASAVSCLMVLLLGSVLAIYLRGAVPLVVYFWTFLLSAVAIIIIHSGETLTVNSQSMLAAGLLLTWMGNLGLLIISGIVYWKLAKH